VNLGTSAPVIALAAGGAHTCALLLTGTVKCWGANDAGQLGLGDLQDRGDDAAELGEALAAIDLGSEATATAITAGRRHSCAVLRAGATKCWGDNGAGQLGVRGPAALGGAFGDMGNRLLPVDLGPGGRAIAVAAGGAHSCAILEGGGIACWGAGATDGAARALFADPFLRPLAITAGIRHTCALFEDFSARCWGEDDVGQLGGSGQVFPGEMLPAPIDLGTSLGIRAAIVSLAAGGAHGCAVLDGRTTKCWGRNHRGQLGLGDRHDRGGDPSQMGDQLPAVILGAVTSP
jgi:alpha-tubulin suppressor-like RCC1 family protein